jgi:hypothetical protein
MTFTQQDELYASERKADLGQEILPEDLQSYVDDLRNNPWVFRCFPMVLRIEAYALKRDGSVGSFHKAKGAGKIEMSFSHLNERIVLHEVAHVLAAARYGSNAHCPWFARTYLELVSLFAPSVYPSLLTAFQEDGIDFECDTTEGKAIAL